MTIIVFYSDGSHTELEEGHRFNPHGIDYQNLWVYSRQLARWFRADWTPALLDDVPKEHRALLLLLTS